MDEESVETPGVNRANSNESKLLRLINQSAWSNRFRGTQQNGISSENIPLVVAEPKIRKSEEERMVAFIRQSFHKKECRCFEENPQRPGRCLTCNGHQFDHSEFLPPPLPPPPLPPSALPAAPLPPPPFLLNTFSTVAGEVCAITIERRCSHSHADKNKFMCSETNAFGRLEFFPKSEFKYRQAPKYVRLAYDGVPNSMRDPHTINNVITLLTRYWHLREPDLVISIIGGGEKFRISNRRRREIFNSGLIKAISATNGWLLTIGSDTGIAKAVGDAVREGQSLRFHSGHVSKQIACIGIAAWGNLRHRTQLVSRDPDKVDRFPRYEYKTIDAGGGIGLMRPQEGERKSGGIGQQGLNPDHTHFLFVDDGRRYQQSGIAEFRSALEHKLEETFARTSVVCLCVEGGAHSLRQVYESLSKGTTVLVCEGSGRISDVIASSYYDPRRQKEKDKGEWLNSIRSHLERLFNDRNTVVHWQPSAEKLDAMRDQIAFVCNSPHLSIFKFENRQDLDLALLQCIMPAKLTSTDNVKQDEGVELALSWNRPDIAEKIMSQTFYNIEKPLLFHKAILENKIAFVTLFVKNGIAVSQYLTSERLTDLYRKTDRTHLMEVVKIKGQHTITLTDVSNLLKRLTGSAGRYENDRLPPDCDPFHELIIYAILFNRLELARYFWNHCQRPLMTALVGTWLSSRLHKHFDRKRDEGCAKDYAAMKEAFEKIALGLLDIAHKMNTDWARKLVNARAFFRWSNSSCMEIAAIADAKDFLGHECCQHEIFKYWKKGFHCHRTKYFVSFLLVIPIFFNTFVRFDENNRRGSSSSRRNSTTEFDDDDEIPVSIPPSERWRMIREQLSTIREQNWVSIEEAPRVEKSRLAKKFSLRKISKFYNAPASTFALHTMSYICYLALYSYVMLFTYERGHIYFAEYLLYFWQFNFFTETLHAISRTHGTNVWARFKHWWERGSFGNLIHIDAINTVLALLAIILRVVSEATHPIARLIMAINVVIYFQRLFKAFFANSYLGPKVIMIWKMTKELLMFCLFFCVFMLSYSVASLALVHIDEKPYPGILWHLFAHGLWEIFGEQNEEMKSGIVMGCNNYTGWDWVSSSHAFDCFLRTKPLPIFLTLYLFFTSILLVNMLIAVFSHIFDTVEENAQQLWKFQMFFLVQEYARKPVVIPPFIVFYHIYLACVAIGRRCRPVAAPVQLENDSEFLSTIENVCRSEYVERQIEQEQQDNRFQIGIDKLAAEFKRNPKSFDHDHCMPMSPTSNAEEEMPFSDRS